MTQKARQSAKRSRRQRIDFGDLTALFTYGSTPSLLMPLADPTFLKSVKLTKDEWFRIESALDNELEENLRNLFTATLEDLIFSIVHSKFLIPPRRYEAKLHEQVVACLEHLDDLLESLTSTDNQKIVASPQDHFVALARYRWGEKVSALVQMHDEMFDVALELERPSLSTRGQEGHFQLRPFYQNLFLIAHESGADTSINTRADRERYAKAFKPTPLIRFVGEVLKILEEQAVRFVSLYLPNATLKTPEVTKLKVLAKKNGKNLIDPLGEARNAIQRRAGG